MKKWGFPVEWTSKKRKIQLSANKVMSSVFWYAHGITLRKRRTINGKYYVNLRRFEENTRAFSQ